MKLIVGLGNPGKEYQHTWHNLGFLTLEQFKPVGWKHSDTFTAYINETHYSDEKIILVKPETFMNESGKTVAAVAAYYKIEPKDIWVAHDEMDLPIGSVRVSRDASAAGHRGVQSIIDHLGTKTFIRFRLGIKPALMRVPTEEYVLHKIGKADILAVQDMLQKAVAALEVGLEDGVTTAMNQFN